MIILVVAYIALVVAILQVREPVHGSIPKLPRSPGMSVVACAVTFLFILTAVSLIDFVFTAPHAPFHGGGRYSGGIGSFMVMLHALGLLILAVAIRAFKPRQAEWIAGGSAAVVIMLVLYETGHIFVTLHG